MAIRDNISRGQAVIAVRARDVAHMAWVMSELESEQAFHEWFDTGASAYEVFGLQTTRWVIR